MRLVFWLSLGLVLYTYAGYPALTILLGRWRRRGVSKAPCEPAVSIIIAAHNEAAHIAATLDNKLALQYPGSKLQIIVVSDASTDGTDEIVDRYRGRVLLLRQEPRRGKTAALNMAVAHATGSILVFADANSLYSPEALRALVQNFHDANVGYVTGRMVYAAAGATTVGIGCTAYMRYEDFLRRSETAVGSIIGVNGGIDAIRASLYRRMSDDSLPDFVLPLMVVKAGYRVVYEPDALLHERTLTTARAEYRMRVRVALRAWWTLAEMRDLFDLRRHGVFAVQLFSHKALRYAMFAAILLFYAAALALSPSGRLYAAAFILTSALGALAAAGWLLERTGRSPGLLGLPYYFLLVNAAAAHALVDFVRGRRRTIWTPRLG